MLSLLNRFCLGSDKQECCPHGRLSVLDGVGAKWLENDVQIPHCSLVHNSHSLSPFINGV